MAQGQLPLTEFARKYGPYASNHFQSGYTPIYTTFPILNPTNYLQKQQFDDFQRHALKGFTSEELAHLDCLPSRELKPGNLQNEILPLLRRELWETTPCLPDFERTHMYPLDDGRGLWSGDNQVVWNILEPCLILATRIIQSTHLMPWFDALMNGARDLIDDSRKQPNDIRKPWANTLESFSPVPSFQVTQATTVDRDKALDKLAKVLRLQWGFMHEDEDPMTGCPLGTGASGLTSVNYTYMSDDTRPDLDKKWRVFIWLDITILEHLLRNDINSADRMMLHWHVANTITHELMHAVDITRYLPETDVVELVEAYFNDEPIAEIGLSFEFAVNHGSTEPFNQDYDHLPLGYWHRREWPTIKDTKLTSQPFILQNPGPKMSDEFYPVPITAYEDMQQDDFWEVTIRKFGHGLLHYRGLTQGAKDTYTYRDARKKKWDENTDRLTGGLSTSANQFRTDYKMFRAVASMEKEDRQIAGFAMKFLASSQAELEFWNRTSHQKTICANIVAHLRTILAQPNSASPEAIAVASLMMDMVKKAIDNHEVMIAAILSAEEANKIKYTNRRTTLLIWNRGTRVFMNRIYGLPAAAARDWREIMKLLERSRMVLWAGPTDFNSGLDTDKAEWTTVQNAMAFLQSGQIPQCLAACNSLLLQNLPTVTLFTSIVEVHIRFDALANVHAGWKLRKAELVDKLQPLFYLSQASQSAGWTQMLDVEKGHYQRLVQLPEPPAPQPVV